MVAAIIIATASTTPPPIVLLGLLLIYCYHHCSYSDSCCTYRPVSVISGGLLYVGYMVVELRLRLNELELSCPKNCLRKVNSNVIMVAPTNVTWLEYL